MTKRISPLGANPPSKIVIHQPNSTRLSLQSTTDKTTVYTVFLSRIIAPQIVFSRSSKSLNYHVIHHKALVRMNFEDTKPKSKLAIFNQAQSDLVHFNQQKRSPYIRSSTSRRRQVRVVGRSGTIRTGLTSWFECNPQIVFKWQVLGAIELQMKLLKFYFSQLFA